MKFLFALLIALTLFASQTSKQPRLHGANVVAFTLLNVCSVPANSDYEFTGFDFTVPKLVDESEMSYAAQITYQFTTPEPYGVLFQIRVRTEDGEYIGTQRLRLQDGTYIGAETGSRGVGVGAFAGNTVPAIDTVFDSRTGQRPLAGVYVFELWAHVGGGECQVMPYETTIKVREDAKAVVAFE